LPEYEQEFQPARPEPQPGTPAIWTLIGLNVLVFIFGLLSGGLNGPTEAGVLWAPGVWQGEWWRLLTAMFLHANLIHLLVNMWALYALGPELEKIYGTPRFVLLYFGAGWAGSLASLMFTGASVGASGAIFGLAGAWLAISLSHRHYFKLFGSQVLTVVLINLAIGFGASGLIDNNGHIGGLLGGLALGLVLPNQLPEFRAAWRRVATVVVLLALLAATSPATNFSRQNLGTKMQTQL
jgi:rhomboid protease GluP